MVGNGKNKEMVQKRGEIMVGTEYGRDEAFPSQLSAEANRW